MSQKPIPLEYSHLIKTVTQSSPPPGLMVLNVYISTDAKSHEPNAEYLLFAAAAIRSTVYSVYVRDADTQLSDSEEASEPTHEAHSEAGWRFSHERIQADVLYVHPDIGLVCVGDDFGYLDDTYRIVFENQPGFDVQVTALKEELLQRRLEREQSRKQTDDSNQVDRNGSQ